MYKLIIRPFLFRFSPEVAHKITFSLLSILGKIQPLAFFVKKIYQVQSPTLQRNIAGLRFQNPIGLAAGLDKDADVFDELGLLGFGFIEIGTVTPKPQPGNPKPRLFRLKKDKALINRMGFNNKGVDYSIEKLKKRKDKNLIIGGNIGKNKITPLDKAEDDYLISFEKLFPYVDYFVINVSSPNTPNLRELQNKKPLTKLITNILKLNNNKTLPKPVFLKIAPDLTTSQLKDIIEIINDSDLTGVIATNTTISRIDLKEENIEYIGAGGLSGLPLKNKSTEIIKFLRSNLKQNKKIIGVGGIFSPDDAIEKIEAGADLIQIFTSFIYEGPSLIKRINKAIIRKEVLKS